MDVSRSVEHWARWQPGRPAVRAGGAVVTYGELAERVARLAGGLVGELGVAQGDRVAYAGPGGLELVELLLATARARATFVPLDPDAAGPAARCEPAVLVGPAADPEAGDEPPLVVAVADLPRTAALAAAHTLDPDTSVLLRHLPGERFALLTHGALGANVLNVVTALGLTAADEVRTTLPLGDPRALDVAVLPALGAGATVAEWPAGEAPAGAPVLVAPAADLVALDPAGARLVVCPGADVPDGVPAVRVYTRPECGVVAAAPAPGAALRPVLTCDVRVVDAGGYDAAPGDTGELLVRGPQVLRELWRDPVATSSTLVEGWFRTGDAGRLDADGTLHVAGRLADLLAATPSSR